MTIKTRIEQIALSICPNYYYGNRWDTNDKLDSLSLPAIILLEPDDYGFSLGEYAMQDSETVFIQFLQQCEMGNDASFRLPIIESMRILAKKFIKAVYNSTDLAFVSLPVNIKGGLVREYQDINAAGIEIQLPLILVTPESYC